MSQAEITAEDFAVFGLGRVRKGVPCISTVYGILTFQKRHDDPPLFDPGFVWDCTLLNLLVLGWKITPPGGLERCFA